jgi:hypothetical protein
MADLSPDERAELERLRQETAPHARTKRSLHRTGATVLLIVAALLGGIAVVSVRLRDQVLNTNTFAETVAPLDNDPAVRAATVNRVTDEITTGSDTPAVLEPLVRGPDGSPAGIAKPA